LLEDLAEAVLLRKQVGGCSEHTIGVGHEKREAMKRPPSICHGPTKQVKMIRDPEGKMRANHSYKTDPFR